MLSTHKHDLTLTNKMKNRKYHIVGEFPKSDYKIAEGANVDTPNTQIHDRHTSRSWDRHFNKMWRG